MSRTIYLANPRGFCAGVDRAISIVTRALSLYGAPIYVRHEVVHNRFVVQKLTEQGAIFIEDIEQVPIGATIIYSAHGVPLSVQEQAKQRQLRVFDATCPLVSKVHLEVKKMHAAGLEIIMIGHAGHAEVEGTMGQCDSGMYLVESIDDVAKLKINNAEKLAFVSQTTLSVDETKFIISALRQRFAKIQAPKKEDICYATQNRQDAVKKLAAQCDLIIVVGSLNSSNSNRLREVALSFGVATYMVDSSEQLDSKWFVGKQAIGVTAGASAPDVLVQDVINSIQKLGASSIKELIGVTEHINFLLPVGLR